MAQNEQPEIYPCYKVVHSDGQVGEYSGSGGQLEKIRKLQAEGIEIENGHIKNLAKYLFKDFKSTKPLQRLRELQKELSAKISLEPENKEKEYKTAGGVDVSYQGPFHGVAAYAQFDLKNKQLLDTETIRERVTFPYIPTYLAFRELPLFVALLQRVQETSRMAEVVLVDGNGILHPRHAGIASHLGVLLNISTIGVTKSLLCGEVNLNNMKPGEIRYVWLNGQKVGAAIKPSEHADPIFISPGNKMDLKTAIKITMSVTSSNPNHKLPEPIRLAHMLSKEQASKGTQISLFE